MTTAEKAKHTPGPWQIDQSGAGLEIRPSRSIHAITILKHGEEANARLIAAAPEMAEALEAIVEAGYRGDEINGKLLAEAEAAIRKARGDE